MSCDPAHGRDRMRPLCYADDLPEATARGFDPPPGGFIGLFAIKYRGAIHVYLNSCPHLGVGLNWAPDRFLNPTGDRLICATHGAEFRIEDGEALRGPCLGERLTKIDFTLDQGVIWVRDDAGL